MTQVVLGAPGALAAWCGSGGAAWCLLRHAASLRPSWSRQLSPRALLEPVPFFAREGPAVVYADAGALRAAVHVGDPHALLEPTVHLLAEGDVRAFDAVKDGAHVWVAWATPAGSFVGRLHTERGAFESQPLPEPHRAGHVALARLPAGMAVLQGLADARLAVSSVLPDLRVDTHVRHPLPGPVRHLRAAGGRQVAVALVVDASPDVLLAQLGASGRMVERPRPMLERARDEPPALVWMDDGFAVFAPSEDGVRWRRIDGDQRGEVPAPSTWAGWGAAYLQGQIVVGAVETVGDHEHLVLRMETALGVERQVHTVQVTPHALRLARAVRRAADRLDRVASGLGGSGYRDGGATRVLEDAGGVATLVVGRGDEGTRLALDVRSDDAGGEDALLLHLSAGVAPTPPSIFRLARWIRERRLARTAWEDSQSWLDAVLACLPGAELIEGERREAFRQVLLRVRALPEVGALRALLRTFAD